MSSKKLHSRVRETLSDFEKSLPWFFRPRRTSSRSMRSERGIMPCCDALAPGQLQSLPPELDLSPFNDSATQPEVLVDAVRNLKPFLPDGCKFLGQGDLKIIGPHPIDAGGFADVWIGERNAVAVAIKSYRHHSLSNCLPIYSRLYNEALACNYLRDGNKSFAFFIGVYSTLEHPFCLVFELMEHLNLREYLKNNRDLEKVDILLQIAYDLKSIHSRGLVHGNLSITNILVGGDGRPRIAGLGAASVPLSMRAGGIEKPPHEVLVPEIIEPLRWISADAGPTTASDLFAFALVALEVFDGKPPFSDRSVFAGVCSILKGTRPDRPYNPGLSDRIWKMIRGCWKGNPAERMSLTEVIAVLESEKIAHRSK